MLETVFNERTMDFAPPIAEPSVRLHLLVVDADAAVRSACAEIAASLGYAVESTGDLSQARTLLRGRAADIVLVDLSPASNGHTNGSTPGLELISEVKLLYPDTSVIAMTASSSVNAAVEAMRCGASDYLTKPFAMDELSTVLDRAAQSHVSDTSTRQLRERLRLSQGLGAMIGREALPHLVEGGPERAPRTDPRREWNRQGAGGADHPRLRPPTRESRFCLWTVARWCPR